MGSQNDHFYNLHKKATHHHSSIHQRDHNYAKYRMASYFEAKDHLTNPEQRNKKRPTFLRKKDIFNNVRVKKSFSILKTQAHLGQDNTK